MPAAKRLKQEDIERLVEIIKKSDRPMTTQELIDHLRETSNS